MNPLGAVQGGGTLPAFYWAKMSTQTTTAPHVLNLPVNDHALTQTGIAMDAVAKIQASKARAIAARKEAEAADKEVKAFRKNRQEDLRKTDRRALLVGRAVLTRAVADRIFWSDLWSDLVESLKDASDDDRALLGLPPMPKTDTQEGSQAAADVGVAPAKKEGEQA